MSPEQFDGRQQALLGFAENAREEGKHFFYVRIPGNTGPLQRGESYEEPLHAALAAENLGEVTGGGSQMGEGDTIEFCGIDVVVTDRGKGLALIRSVMLRVGAPADTVIEDYLPEYKEHSLR